MVLSNNVVLKILASGLLFNCLLHKPYVSVGLKINCFRFSCNAFCAKLFTKTNACANFEILAILL